jgi:hypothetical protein
MAMADKTPVRRDIMSDLPKQVGDVGAIGPFSQEASQREQAPAGPVITEGEFPVKATTDDSMPMKLGSYSPSPTNPPLPEPGSRDGFPEAPEGGLTKG